MELNLSVNAIFLGRQRDRFRDYQPDVPVDERIRRVKGIEGVTGVELKYPYDFADEELVKRTLDEESLVLSAVNADIKDIRYFRHGCFGARDPNSREKAIEIVTGAMDVSARFGANLVTTCPLADSYDYPFQINYTRAWDLMIESVKKAASHRRDVTLAVEYQAREPNARVLLCNAGKALHLCAEADEPNLGVNLDVGHSFAAGESPAETAALLARKGLLKYIHSCDNTADGADWDMFSGSVHLWNWIELLYVLREVGYDGWFSGDLAAKQMDAVSAFRANFRMLRRMNDALDRLDLEKLRQLVDADGMMGEIYDLLGALLEGGA